VKKILIANRGEIAVRVARACRDLGLRSVAVFSDSDRAARYVRMADEAVPIGPSAPAESYLHAGRLIAAAHAAGADAVHPGYGFLSENASFAQACRSAGLIFVGPSPDAMALLGDKAAARRVAASVGVPVVPGSGVLHDSVFHDAIDGAIDDAIAREGRAIGYPLMVKAVAGGGGKGMRVVRRPEDLPSAVRAARSEAASAFGDASLYLERAIDRPRHVEVQLLGDHFGTILPFVERECSIQRRHQKVIEESPSTAVSEPLRARLAAAAVAVARAAGYTNAGTVEFLVEETGAFYFLEMNTRLQVEHPVTEMVTGVDLVAWQIRIARGDRLDVLPAAVLTARGHAVECRVYAEDPDAGFLPSPGRISALRMPAGPGLRDDCGVEVGSEIPVHYDPLIAKIVAWGEDRSQAVARMARAMRETEVVGVRTSVPFFQWILQQPTFLSGEFHTGYLDALLHERRGETFVPAEASHEEVAAVAAALYRTLVSDRVDDAGRERRPTGDSGTCRAGRTVSAGIGSRSLSWKRAAREEAVGT
jgi:acetyl-CoA carboxylase biotin carboxylase subunit